MAYQNYFPATYQTMYPQQPQMQTQPQSNSIVWVQGEVGARAYPVAPGNSMILLDSESSVFYLKSTDASGMPMPLRIFDFKERTQQTTQTPLQTTPNLTEYVRKDELEQLIHDMLSRKEEAHE